ncbi:MAG: DUF4240 domain-containing protein [Planctomycetes bacterium]|nr:DUF4240 domain-containing protein [Planctomycetota bacterium]
MDEAQFWDLVDSAHREAGLDVARKVAALKTRLAALSLDELREFCAIWDRTMNRAYDWKLWAAAYVIHGGCSDDSFSDFRATVISLGRATFEAALRDPDTLLEVARAAGGELCEEDLNYVPSDVWGARTGGESRPSSVPHQEEPHGEDWGTDDLPRIVPKLWKAFGS